MKKNKNLQFDVIVAAGDSDENAIEMVLNFEIIVI